jgi:hypothetical protein
MVTEKSIDCFIEILSLNFKTALATLENSTINYFFCELSYDA